MSQSQREERCAQLVKENESLTLELTAQKEEKVMETDTDRTPSERIVRIPQK